MSTLNVVSVMKNEAPYVVEWLEFHRAAGVGHFYLYLNNCTDETELRLAPFVASGDVTVLHQDGHPCQGPAFADAVAQYATRSDWLVFLDVDEFLFLPSKAPLGSFLDGFTAFGGLYVRWYMYGSNGLLAASPEPVTRRLTRRAATPHTYGKTLLNTHRLLRGPRGTDDLHFCAGLVDTIVDENQTQLWHATDHTPSAALIRINHYGCKSHAEFAAKVAKGRCDRPGGRHLSDLARYDCNEVEDAILA